MPVRGFFNQETNFLKTTLPAGNDLLLSRTTLLSSDISDQSILISPAVPSQQIFEILEDILGLDSADSIASLLPTAQSWVLTQKNKHQITEELEQHMTTKVRSTVQQKISHCIEELVTNAICASDAKPEKPIHIALHLGSEMQVLVIRDGYGNIDKNAKSKILSKITKETIAPQMKREEGGAGVGLNLVKEFCDFLIIRHHKEQWTECCCYFLKKHLSQTPFLYLEV